MPCTSSALSNGSQWAFLVSTAATSSDDALHVTTYNLTTGNEEHLEISTRDLLQATTKTSKAKRGQARESSKTNKGHVTCISAVASQEKDECICYYGTSRGDCGSLSISDGGKKYSKGWQAEAVHEKGNTVRMIRSCEDDDSLFSVASGGGNQSIEISQVSAETGERVKAFQEGFPSEIDDIQGMHVLEDKSYAFLAVGKETFHLYSFAKEKSICTLVSSSPGKERQVAGFASCLGDKFLVGAYAGSAQLDVWKFTRKAVNKPQTPSCSISLPVSTSGIESCVFHQSEPVVACVAANGKNKLKVRCVYLYKLELKAVQSKVKDTSRLLATIHCGSEQVISVQLDPEGNRCLVATVDVDGKSCFQVLTYDPELENQELSIESSSKSSEKKKKRKQPETPESKPSPLANGKANSEAEEDHRSLEARVSQMDINNRSKLITERGQQQSPLDQQNAKTNGSAGGQLTADSAAVLLSQALQSSDKQLLEQCLNVRQEQVISNTVKQLRSDQVGKLVPLLVERINTSSTRAMQVSCWIRHVVRHHLTYIISAPSIKGHLSVLYQHLEERQSSYNALLGLQGRLELLTTYIKSMRQQKQLAAQNEREGGEAGSGNDYYSDPAVVHVHENEDTETISLVPQIEAAGISDDDDDDDSDEEMGDASSSSDEEDED